MIKGTVEKLFDNVKTDGKIKKNKASQTMPSIKGRRKTRDYTAREKQS